MYATTHLANSASLLRPVSKLTNLLAFRATDLSFAGFAARRAVAIAIEWAVLRKVFAQQLESRGRTPRQDVPPLPRRPIIVLALTVYHAAGADILVVARDGRHFGPHSIGHEQRWGDRPGAVHGRDRLAGGRT